MNALTSIAAADIESELTKLWEAQREKNKIKACLFNLVLFSQDSRRTNYFRELIRSTIEKFPCRILFIEGDEVNSGDRLGIQVSNQTILRGDSLIACDQINVQASRNQYVRIPFLIIPHLIADLPLYLLWGQDPMSDHIILPKLLPLATRLIFDSECTQNLQTFSQRLLSKLPEMSHLELMDMNWARLSGWRDAIANVFEPAYRLEHLFEVERVVLRYQSKPTEFFKNTQTQALYLTAWLAAQLQWNFVNVSTKEKVHELQFKCNGKSITVVLEPEERPTLDPGSILGVMISCTNSFSFQFERDETTRKVTIHVSNREWCEAPVTLPLPNLQRGFTFIKEMFHRQAGEHYRNTLQVLAQIPWSTQCPSNGVGS